MPRQYKVTPGFLVEMPRIKAPLNSPFADYTGDPITADKVADQWERYNQHIASLQRIPIPPNVSFEGEIINEDQFEVRAVYSGKSYEALKSEHFTNYAFPVKPKQPEGKEKGEGFHPANNLMEATFNHSFPSPQPQPTQEEVGRDERDMWAQVCGALAAYNSNGMGISEKIDRLQSQFTIQKRNTNG